MFEGASQDLRKARTDRVFAAVDEAGLDVLVLGRRHDITYATGAQSLWTAGTRPFGAACVLVAAERSVHLLSTWDEGMPPEIPFENLYGVTWNPARMGDALRSIPGFAEARRLGVDAWSPGFARAAARLAPEAELVAADSLMDRVRQVKLPEEIDRIRAANAAVREAFDVVLAELATRPGDSHLLGVALRVMAGHGTTTPTTTPAVQVDDDVAVIDLGFLVDGYEGSIARTVSRGTGAEVSSPSHDSLVSACRAGASGVELRVAAQGCDRWLVRGSGLGAEPPVITDDVGDESELLDGMVLAVESSVGRELRRDVVSVGSGDVERF